jgi:hypothetical protein
MDRIFASTSHVIVDLGEETHSSSVLFGDLIEADKMFHRLSNWVRQNETGHFVPEPRARFPPHHWSASAIYNARNVLG